MATETKSNTKHQKFNSRNPNSAPNSKTLNPSERFDTVALPFASSSSSSSRSQSPEQPDGPTTAMAGYVKLDDKVRISLDSVRSDLEVRKLKRKLISELEKVRSLRKRIEAGGVECVNGFNGNTDGGGEGNFGNGEDFVGSIGRVGTVARVNSEVSYVGPTIAVAVKSGEELRDKNCDEGGGGVGVGAVVDKEKEIPKGNQSRKDSGVASGKEKLLNPEGEKKLKPSGGGRKGGGGDVPGFGSGMDRYPKGLFKKCVDLLVKLMKHKYGWVFNAPVDVKKLKLYDYYTIIKHPMDLGTVKTRLTKNWYKSPLQFAEDVRLTFNNAMTYNDKGQDVHIMADALLKIFAEQWAAVSREYNMDERLETEHDASLPTPTSKKVPAAHTFGNASLRRPPLEKDTLNRSKMKDSYTIQGKKQVSKMPKSKDPAQRCMTYEEKQKLSTNLQNLPSDKLESVVQIIRKRNPNLFQQEDEIEVDIDCFDNETLWELDSFVTNYLKSLTKSAKKADIAGEEATKAVGHNMHESYVTSKASKTPKGPEKVGRIAHASSVAQGEKKGYGASGSNGSNCSSSDSSSKDSESDSSSGGSDDHQ